MESTVFRNHQVAGEVEERDTDPSGGLPALPSMAVALGKF